MLPYVDLDNVDTPVFSSDRFHSLIVSQSIQYYFRVDRLHLLLNFQEWPYHLGSSSEILELIQQSSLIPLSSLFVF